VPRRTVSDWTADMVTLKVIRRALEKEKEKDREEVPAWPAQSRELSPDPRHQHTH
jgi:hypothetical protein